jgi:7-dehydrocholesterol reductase
MDETKMTTNKHHRQKKSSSPPSTTTTTTTTDKKSKVNHEITDIWSPQNYSTLEQLIREYIGPLFLMIICPIFVNVAAFVGKYYQSDVFLAISSNSTTTILSTSFVIPSYSIIKIIILFCTLETILLLLLPGKIYEGARAPSGYVPTFKDNGGMACILTLCAFKVFTDCNLLNPCIVYDELLGIQTLLNITALIMSIGLFLKGILFPSTKDHGSNSSLIFRLYWGEELYPRIWNNSIDLKHLIISRWGMMGWLMFTTSLMYASIRYHDGYLTPSMAISGLLNFFYVIKFFVFFEQHYMKAADIAVDRLGFMLCWGTIGFMPLVHNLQTLHLVKNDGIITSWPLACFLIGVGFICIYLNYDSDTQRHRFREIITTTKNGKMMIWGKEAQFIRAKYHTVDGKSHESLLLMSGYHGIARHIHYLFDIIWLFLLAIPCGFHTILPWTYCIYLTSLLLDRTYRIDSRCKQKYGKYWEMYENKVRWKLIPGVW